MRATLGPRSPDVEALAGTAEAIPLPDASADAVLVAQAFHWFEPRAGVRRDRARPAPGRRARARLEPARRVGAVGRRPRSAARLAGRRRRASRRPELRGDRAAPGVHGRRPARASRTRWRSRRRGSSTGRRPRAASPRGPRPSGQALLDGGGRARPARIPTCTSSPCSRCPTRRWRSGSAVHGDEPHAVDPAQSLEPFERLGVGIGVDGEHHHRAACPGRCGSRSCSRC